MNCATLIYSHILSWKELSGFFLTTNVNYFELVKGVEGESSRCLDCIRIWMWFDAFDSRQFSHAFMLTYSQTVWLCIFRVLRPIYPKLVTTRPNMEVVFCVFILCFNSQFSSLALFFFLWINRMCVFRSALIECHCARCAHKSKLKYKF